MKLRIGSVARAVLVTGQAYQDPKDALNEFVSNSADEYVASEEPGRIRVILRRRGRYPTIAVDDNGAGMSPDRLRQVAQNLFKSVKAGDDRTLGEKAIGLLAFQQLGGRMEVVSRAEGSDETWCLKLDRGAASAHLAQEKRRARSAAGTTVYLGQLNKDVLRMLTQRKVVDYLRRRRSAALEAGLYEIEVIEGRASELVTTEEPAGVKVPLKSHSTLWGPLEFSLYVSPPDATERAVAVVGRAGTTIIDDLTEMDEFQTQPWTSGQVAGRVMFAPLQQSAGRRAIVRDDDAFPVFLDTVRSVEPVVQTLIERVRAEVDQDATDRMAQQIQRVFASVLKELEDLDNPMRSPTGGLLGEVGDSPGDVGVPGDEDDGGPGGNGDVDESGPDDGPDSPGIDDLTGGTSPIPPAPRGEGRQNRRSRKLPTLEPDPEPGGTRSRFDPDEGIVYYSAVHPDFLMVKGSEPELLDYLATLVAKEYVVYNNPMAAPGDLAEEMVRMVIRVRRRLNRATTRKTR